MNYLIHGFTHGFSLGFEGDLKCSQNAPNLKLCVGSLAEIWTKVMKEVKDKRFARPYKSPPFDKYIQWPIGLVPKDNGTKTRLIFHLSYPRNSKNLSVNANIPKDKCTVKYKDFDAAVKCCIQEGIGCNISKSDMSMAFRNVPLDRDFWKYLVLKAQHRITLKWYYFVEKCLPFGASISCKLFQDFSDSIAHIIEYITHKETVNYLDDFLFAALLKI